MGGRAGGNLAGNMVPWVIDGLFIAGIVVAAIVYCCCDLIKGSCCRPKPLLSKRKMDSIINKHNIFRHKTLKESQSNLCLSDKCIHLPVTPELKRCQYSILEMR